MASNDGPLGHLEEDIYSREGVRRKAYDPLALTKDVPRSRQDWEHRDKSSLDMPRKKNKKKFAFWFFFVALVFFLGAVLVAAYVMTRGGTFVSSRNVTIDVSGPVSVSGGEPVALDITITNKNSARLERADLVVEFPQGTRSASTSEALTRIREPLGEIASGAHMTYRIDALFFGEEGAKLPIKISIEYRLEKSNALFESERLYELEVSSAPVSLIISAPREVTSGQEIEITAEIISNAEDPLPGVALIAEYPPGFFLKGSDPDPDSGDNLWNLGALLPGDRQTVVFTGVLEGQDEEVRVLHFSLGILGDDGNALETTLLTLSRDITISRPFVTARLSINGVEGDVVTLANGGRIRGEVFWQNNVSVALQDVRVEVLLSSDIIDERTVRPIQGSYRSSDDTMVWTKADVPQLANVSPGASGRLQFEFETVKLSRTDEHRSPSFTLTATVRGDRREGDATGPVSGATTLEARIASAVAADARAVHFIGPFENRGPIPPEAEEETTYTIYLSLANTANDVDNTVVTAELPANAEWLGNTNPESADVSFDSASRIVRWNAGTVGAGVGYGTPPKEVAFQIAVVPSVTDVGSSLTLMLGGLWSGTDRFTGTSQSGVLRGVTSLLEDDPEADEDDGIVEP